MSAAIMIASLLDSVRDPDIAQEVILRKAANLMPVAAVLLNAGRIRLSSTEKFGWTTDTLNGRTTAINNVPDDYDENTTSIVVDDGTVFARNTLIYFEATGEVGLVTGVSTNTLTVVRGLGSVVAAAAASVADDAAVRNIGAASGEGSPVPTAAMAAPTLVENYVQNFRKSVKHTGRSMRERTKTQDERLRQRAKALDEITRDVDYACLFGAKSKSANDSSGNIVTTTGGIVQALSTNVVDIGGALTKANLRSALVQIFAEGSQEKIGFCGTDFLEYVHTLYDGNLQITPSETLGGFVITKVPVPGGVLNLQAHRGMTGARSAECIVVDPAEAELRYVEDADNAENTGRLHLRENVERDGDDAETDEWFADLGLQWGNEAAHGLIEGATAPS